MPQPERKKYTLEEFYAMELPERCEFIEGDIFIGESEEPYDPALGPVDMAPAPNYAHQGIAADILTDVKLYIRKNKGKCKAFMAPADVKLNNSVKVQPDVFVTCKPENIDGQTHHGAPDWVIEILSPSSISRDMQRKLYLYRDSGVREYWIVDPMTERVVVYFFEETKSTEIFTFDSEITVNIYKDAPEPLIIRLADHFE